MQNKKDKNLNPEPPSPKPNSFCRILVLVFELSGLGKAAEISYMGLEVGFQVQV